MIVKKIILVLFMSLTGFGLFFSPSKELSQDSLDRFILAHKKLRQLGISMGEVQQQNYTPQLEVEKIIKECGFENIQDFLYLNTRVLSALSIIETEEFQKKLQAHESNMKKVFQENNFSEILNNPDIPESTKIEIRKSFAESRQNFEKQMQEINREKEKNKRVSKSVLEVTSKFSSDSDKQLVRKNYTQIKEALTGVSFTP
jgi:hypothetical protein